MDDATRQRFEKLVTGLQTLRDVNVAGDLLHRRWSEIVAEATGRPRVGAAVTWCQDGAWRKGIVRRWTGKRLVVAEDKTGTLCLIDANEAVVAPGVSA
jgi:hypothetical protein